MRVDRIAIGLRPRSMLEAADLGVRIVSAHARSRLDLLSAGLAAGGGGLGGGSARPAPAGRSSPVLAQAVARPHDAVRAGARRVREPTRFADLASRLAAALARRPAGDAHAAPPFAVARVRAAGAAARRPARLGACIAAARLLLRRGQGAAILMQCGVRNGGVLPGARLRRPAGLISRPATPRPDWLQALFAGPSWLGAVQLRLLRGGGGDRRAVLRRRRLRHATSTAASSSRRGTSSRSSGLSSRRPEHDGCRRWRALAAAALVAVFGGVDAAQPAAPRSPLAAAEVASAAAAVAADPGLGGTQSVRSWRFKRDDDKVTPREPPPPWLLDLRRWLGEGGRALVWLLGLAALACLVVGSRRWWSVHGEALVAASARLPSHVRDLDIRPESLPAEIGAAGAPPGWRASTGRRCRCCIAARCRGWCMAWRCRSSDRSTEGDCVRARRGDARRRARRLRRPPGRRLAGRGLRHRALPDAAGAGAVRRVRSPAAGEREAGAMTTMQGPAARAAVRRSPGSGSSPGWRRRSNGSTSRCRQPPSGEAARDRYYAAKALPRRLGATVVAPQSLATLPPPGAGWCSARTHWNLFPEREAALREWVEAGGQLVVDGAAAGANCRSGSRCGAQRAPAASAPAGAPPAAPGLGRPDARRARSVVRQRRP